MRSLVPDVSRFYECFILYVGFSILIFFYHSDLKILGLHHKVDQHAIVIYIKKGNRNITTDSLSTPGFVEDFFGMKDNRTECGQLILQSFRQAFECKLLSSFVIVSMDIFCFFVIYI